MNSANALGFTGLGGLMWLLPFVAPALFPPHAVDGSSTRALWLQVMGTVQILLGLAYLFRGYAAPAPAVAPAVARGASTSADWQGDGAPEPMLAVDFAGAAVNAALRARAGEPAGSITLHGEHAALWRAFNQALRRDGYVRHLADRVAALVHADPGDQRLDGALAGEAGNVVPFVFRREPEFAQPDAA